MQKDMSTTPANDKSPRLKRALLLNQIGLTLIGVLFMVHFAMDEKQMLAFLWGGFAALNGFAAYVSLTSKKETTNDAEND